VKIDLLGPVYPWRGGIAHHTARLARELKERGHDVVVYNYSRLYPKLLFPGTTQLDRSSDTIDADSLQCIDSMNPLSWVATARRVTQRRPDVLAVAWWHPFFAPPCATIAHRARAAGVDVVWLCHNVLPHEPSPVDRLLASLAYSAASRFVVQAEAERARIAPFAGQRRVDVCPHPAYDVFAQPAQGADAAEARASLGVTTSRMLLFFGLIRPYKGLDILIDAVAQLGDLDDLTLYVAGECYGDESVYRAQIERLGLTTRVRFESRYVANEEVPALMLAADVVVLPYRHATQSGVAQVAFACGRPVITTRVGGLPDVVHDGDNGLLVPPVDPTSLAAAIRRFYEPGRAATLAAGAVASAAANTWTQLATVIEGNSPP
jgi:glycosyltransferase involved in cell wall biosynthesis